jgi:hypothetical protein
MFERERIHPSDLTMDHIGSELAQKKNCQSHRKFPNSLSRRQMDRQQPSWTAKMRQLKQGILSINF